jgi:hypothetical protein
MREALERDSRRIDFIDNIPVFLEYWNFADEPVGAYLQFWGGCDKVTFSDTASEEELLTLLDIVTEFVNFSIAAKKVEK